MIVIRHNDESEKQTLCERACGGFCLRAGGAIALYTSRGYRVRILCLSFGERGESQGSWKQDGMTIERVKEIRRAESTKAAGIPGAEVRFFDAGDYTELGKRRGSQAVRNGGSKEIRYAEAFERVSPQMTGELA